MNKPRIESLLKFILLSAAELDDVEWYERELGPIHLIKYVYLADLAYSKSNDGQTYTSINWSFHHFGPWSVELYQHIDPILTVSGARKREFVTDWDTDSIRWSLSDAQIRKKLMKELNVLVWAAIRRFVKKFGNDTASLLKYVYSTRPMLKAAPGEILDFTLADFETKSRSELPEIEKAKTISAKKRNALKENIRSRLVEKEKEERLEYVTVTPVYDEVYFKGVEWLDSLAGPPVEDIEGELEFPNEIWKMPGRADELS